MGSDLLSPFVRLAHRTGHSKHVEAPWQNEEADPATRLQPSAGYSMKIGQPGAVRQEVGVTVVGRSPWWRDGKGRGE